MQNSEAKIETLLQLCERSEDRIDRTNAMISQLTAVIANLTQSYDTHIHELEESRNEVMRQNSMLISILEGEHKKSTEVLSMHERLVSSLISLSHSGSSNSISMGDAACGNR